ncbi:hypothetical protein IP68_12355 [Blastomonas sp. AAP25]|uniref:hypothetical protein n=1 Tax=Blastomonas sp. AAP25 TaxID=1523416 RepID=UPI0006B8D09B|nr:hypothetical protein [Blastomonas sp. AAP25]KPF74553.1 hypothetical protein IP68_12355 [Blastomonas sp. AAP25]
MSYLDKVKGSSASGGGANLTDPVDNPHALIEWYEGNNQHMQAVRVRLWNGMPQRDAHREMVEKWQASSLAFDNPPPPVPHWVKRGEPIGESEERRMERCLWLMTKGKTPQSQVNAWPPRWRQIATTRGYLDADGMLRKFAKNEGEQA